MRQLFTAEGDPKGTNRLSLFADYTPTAGQQDVRMSTPRSSPAKLVQGLEITYFPCLADGSCSVRCEFCYSTITTGNSYKIRCKENITHMDWTLTLLPLSPVHGQLMLRLVPDKKCSSGQRMRPKELTGAGDLVRERKLWSVE